MIRILLVDDHAQYRSCVREWIERQADMRVVGEAATGQEALDLCERAAMPPSPALTPMPEGLPDVVLMDMRLAEMGGIEATHRLRTAHPHLAVLALSSHDDAALVRAHREAGGAGYMLKDAPLADLLSAIRAVAAGHRGVGGAEV